MDTIFINPNLMQPPVGPLAIEYLANALHTSGIACKVVDLCREYPHTNPAEIPLSFWKWSLPRPPSAILITLRNLDDAYFTSQESFLPQYRALVRRLRKAIDVPVIVGGSALSIAPERILDYLEADLGVAGAAEGDLLCLLDCLSEQDSYPYVPGLVWRDGGATRSNPPSPPSMEKDYFSTRGSVHNNYYFQMGGMVGLETKRGCTGTCRYCVDPIAKGRGTFTKPLPFLIKEIEYLVDCGVTVFHLCDSEFNLPREHALAVCRALQEEGLSRRVRWYTYATPQGFDEHLAFEMAEAGCAGINFGVDHCTPEILSSLGRQHRREDIERTARAAHRAGLVFLFDLLLGGPGETRKTLREVIELCRELEVPRVGTPVGIRLYPHTALAGELEAQGPLEENPNLSGTLVNNQDLLFPVFYVSAELGNGWESYLASLVGGDQRFFFSLPEQETSNYNYNYNANQVLIEAIRQGHKGAFWDILRRVQEGIPPLQIPGKERI